jgi:hypothetical protein
MIARSFACSQRGTAATCPKCGKAPNLGNSLRRVPVEPLQYGKGRRCACGLRRLALCRL